jgi:predicted nucleic acid-binding protein
MGLVLSLDLNVILSYFHFISNDREAMRQLRVLVKRHRVPLLLPDHVVHEFARNRVVKVAESLKILKGDSRLLANPLNQMVLDG